MNRRGAPPAPPAEGEWAAALRARIEAVLPGLVPGAPAVVALEPLADEVWLAWLSDGTRVVAKHLFYGLLTRGEPYDLLALEVQVLAALGEAGCPVPRALGADPASQLLFLECAGPRTLADALATGEAPSPAERRRWTRLLWRGLARIEAALAGEERWGEAVVPGGGRDELQRAWAAAARAARESLERRLAAAPAALAAFDELAEALGRRPPSLGPTDYQPANLVLDANGQRLTFLELGKLGWDWSERRAVQYATCASAPERPGLIDAAAAAAWADAWEGSGDGARRAALDGHHLVYHLLLARRVLERGGPPAALAQVVAALGTPLSGDPAALEIRGCIAATHSHQETHHP